jgi:hypothetical protein
VIKPFVSDLCYNAIIVLRANDVDEPDSHYENQAVGTTRKLGIHRIRAIEQIKALLAAINRVYGLKESGLITETVRRKIIETVLYLIKTYHFCSISHQLGLVILNYLKELFDEEDLRALKGFVQECFRGNTRFIFPSGQVASGMTMGQVTKIAFELRNITQQALNNMDSSDNEDEENEEHMRKCLEITQWQRFCKEKIDKLYKIWETRLGAEQPSDSESDDPQQDDKPDDDEEDEEKRIESLFENFNPIQHSRTNV